MADVFVSYSRQDKARAALFVELLEDQGWDVFWDQETRAGSIWPKVLEDELNQARCLIVLWTAGSVASRWVRIEAYEALQNDKLLPVRLEPVKPPMEFRQTQNFDLIGWTGGREDPRLQHLFADLCAFTTIEPRNRPIDRAAAVTAATMVPAGPATGEPLAAPSSPGGPDSSANQLPTDGRAVPIAVPTVGPVATAPARAVESSSPRDERSAEPVEFSRDATTPAANPAAADRLERDTVAGWALFASDATRSRLWWGVGLAAVTIGVVWIVRAVVVPGSEPQRAALKPKIVAPTPEMPVSPAVIETPPASQVSPPVASTVAVPTPHVPAKPSRATPARCIEIADKFQTTGQLTDEERRFLSSKECAR